MKKIKIRTITYRLLALLLVATTIWTSSIMAAFATSDETAEAESICGSVAHTHTQEACYTQTKTLICELEADSTHTHEGTCYEYENKLICEQVECDAHTHGDGCYTTERSVSCGKEETAGHTHSASCYGTETVLICTNTEEGHTHETSCWTEKETLVCQEPECEAHVHETDCYTEAKELSCGKSETAGHTHGDACYEQQATNLICQIHVHSENCYQAKDELTCQLTEHTHTEECYNRCTCNPADGAHQEGCVFYVPVEKCEHCGVELAEDAVHAEDCLTHCTCGYVDNVHTDSCPLYVPIEKCKYCGAELVEDAVHAEDCFTRCTCGYTDEVHQEGCVLYKESGLPQQVIFSGSVSVSGKLPETAELFVAEPTAEDLTLIALGDNEQLAFAYDISIVVDNAEYRPESPVEVTVPLQSELPEGTDWTLAVQHIADNGAVETVSSCLNSDGTVTFTASSFSAYIGTLTVTNNKTDGKIGDYIYFDLAAGNVTIDNSTYTGYIYKDTDTLMTVTGTHSDSNQYYVYQSTEANRATTGLVGESFNLPEYSALSYGGEPWGDYITNNTDVTSVIEAWASAIGTARTPTNYAIKIATSGTGNDCDITIDNLWTTYDGGNGSHGGIMVTGAATNGTKVTVRLKGDNRMNRIYYATSDSTTTSSLTFTSANGDKRTEGTLTVIGDTSRTVENNNYKGDVTKNHWHSVIGASDGADDSRGYYFNGGTIFAGSGSKWENCTAIGAGGNGIGEVTINGGRITAIANTTGTAIGGGIAHTGTGGSGIVTINDGYVYAYNFGVQAHDVVSNYGSAGAAVIEAASHIPGTAIGGASSIIQAGSNGTVEINGGYVYAESLGGSALGGGNSVNKNAGFADISITGGTVEAISKSGRITFDDGKVISVSAGAAIGGGTGGINGNGGYAKIAISGGTIKTGSIGGGGTIKPDGNIGYASATITGGDITGQFIMAAGGTDKCTFTMSGGALCNSDTSDTKYIHLKADGGAVYMDDPNGAATISGGTIKNCSAQNGGAVYMTAGTFTLSGEGTIQNCTASGNGGAVYLGGGTMTISGGSVIGNKAVNGGAAYLGGGTLTISGGSIQSNNASANGGGAYLSNGTLAVSGGSITSNTAANDGGGAYVSGGVLKISAGSLSSNTAGRNGGGACVENGNVVMSGGAVDSNRATNGAGGGMYVSTNGSDAGVTIYSGSVNGNTAKTSGGAVAVVGTTGGNETITVTLGLNKLHSFTDNGLTSISHSDDYGNYTHSSCPVIENNSSTTSGGALYITGGSSTNLNIYCLLEENNRVGDGKSLSNCMMVEGGTVNISSSNPDTGKDNHGNTEINGTVHVRGGNVMLGGGSSGDVTHSGTTSNPKFNDAITVDVTDAGGSFTDNRRSDEYFKLLYFENFKDPTTGKTTGQYTAYQYLIGTEITISGVIYSHPGYEIVCWYTNSTLDGNGTRYEVNSIHNLNDNLKIYAIWEAHGYTITFDPNVPIGETYTGVMTSQTFNYNVKGYLQENTYKYPGYIFTGWNTKPDGSGTRYGDEAEILNLTTKDGAVIPLYAQWQKCTHDPMQSACSLTYSVDSTGTILRRDCSCEGQTLYTVLSAEDTVYDGKGHPARVVYTDASSWAPEVVYKKDKDSVKIEGIPTNAGTYTASVIDGGKTISVVYTIAKADQPAPEKPTFEATILDSSSALSIKPVSASSVGTTAQYRLAYYDGGEWKFTNWHEADATNNGYACVIKLDIALVNYYVEARYAGNENYNDSPATRGDQVFFYEGDVKITVNCDPGISAELSTYTGTDGNSGGVSIKATLDSQNYYLENGDFDVNAVTTGSDSAAELSGSGGEYLLSKIPSDCEIVVTITGAKKKATVDSKATNGQVFGTVSNNSATISRDSAFTACFAVSNYDANVYSDMELSFSSALPKNATIIVLNKTDGSYWHYSVSGGAVSTVALDAFERMGGSDKFAVSGTELVYQFIVDFSRSAGCSGDALTMSLTATKENDNAPDFSGQVSVGLRDESRFLLDVSEDSGLTQTLTLTYTVSSGAASKWDNRNTAVVLTPQNTLPPDATLLGTQSNGQKVSWPMNRNGTYIIPLSAVGSEKLSVELVSALFPSTETTYTFTAQWIVSNSKAAKAPVSGETVVPTGESVSNVTFTKAAEKVPSMRVEGTQRLLTLSDTLQVTVRYELPAEGCTITADLMRKNADGDYSSTAWRQVITGSGSTLSVPLSAQNSGSFCLMLTMKQGVDTVLQVPYYFIVQ